jgi:hypothetical protein
LYTAILPAALRSIEDGYSDHVVIRLAESIAQLAENEGRHDVSRIMASVAKNRFKRKEDFLRQAASALRENFWKEHATEIMTTLLGCLLNDEKWIRTKSLQILKAVLHNIDSRNPFHLAGSQLLLPLLRLLSGELATQAMEVLDTPMLIKGGPSAAKVVRMSMFGLLPAEPAAEVVVFGSPSASGWCIANTEEQVAICRRNLSAVALSSAKLTQVPLKRRTILFAPEPESEDLPRLPAPSEPAMVSESQLELQTQNHRTQPSDDNVSLGELVNTLHDLSTFFQSDIPTQPPPRAMFQTDHGDPALRVAAILSRSLARPTVTDTYHHSYQATPALGAGWPAPPTPFVGLFDAPAVTASEALRRNFMRTAEEDEDEDDQSDAAHDDDHDLISYDPSREASTARDMNSPHRARPTGHASTEDWESEDEELEASFVMETPSTSSHSHAPSSSWSIPRRNSIKRLLSPRRSPKERAVRR